MAKRSEKSVRRVKATLATPVARRRQIEAALNADALRQMAIPALGDPYRGTFDDGTGTSDPTKPIGASGTLNIWGYISGEDYNPDLDGYPMFAKYDQMRRADAQVNASLLQVKLPLKAARRVITPASDDPEDLAIADFVTECVLADGAFARPFTQVLDNALLRFDFGCSAEEIVWTIGEAGEIRFKDLAPRLPRTFYRWVVDPTTGQLNYLQQFAPDVNGGFKFFDIPGPGQGIKDRLVLHTHLREGDNWFGRSLLRAAYPHYFWKQQLYRIDAIRHDRLGAGIFIAKLTSDYVEKSAPLAKLEETLRGLRSHDQTYAIEPVGVEFRLLMAQGGAGDTTDIMKSVEHHNIMIAQNVLQQFSTQGLQRHGSFGAAKVSSEAFFDALEGQSKELAAEFTDCAIKKLCNANFDMKGRAYPQFAFADIATTDTAAIAEYVSTLAAAHVWTPDDAGETWLRELVDAPDLPEELKGRDRTPPPTMLPVHGFPPASGQPKPGHPVPAKLDAATREPFLEQGRKFGRAPTDLERKVFDLHGVPSALDEQQAVLVRALSAIRKTQLQTVAARIAQKDGRKQTAAFTDIRHAHIKMPGVADAVKAIRKAQTRALDYGRQTVREELTKQGVRVPHDMAGPTAAASKKGTTSTLVSSAQITAKKNADTWQARIMDTGLRLRRTGLQGQELTDRIERDLDDEIESGAKRDAAGEINEAFGLGRAGAANDYSDSIEDATYSCVLDANTCDNCAELDGEVFEIDSPEYEQNLPPNAGCQGGDACRCVYILQAKEQAA